MKKKINTTERISNIILMEKLRVGIVGYGIVGKRRKGIYR